LKFCPSCTVCLCNCPPPVCPDKQADRQKKITASGKTVNAVFVIAAASAGEDKDEDVKAHAAICADAYVRQGCQIDKNMDRKRNLFMLKRSILRWVGVGIVWQGCPRQLII
jgi:hypothetical protein